MVVVDDHDMHISHVLSVEMNFYIVTIHHKTVMVYEVLVVSIVEFEYYDLFPHQF